MEQGAQTLALLAQHVTDANRPAIAWINAQLATVEWSKPAIAALLKAAQTQFNVKTPQVMMPLRILLTGTAQAPAVDALLLTLGRDESVSRIHG
jgi:glutamyl-tRNA synthetase